MTDTKIQPIGSEQMPQCQICHLQPAPESSQHIIFIIAAIMLLFYSLKLAAVTVLLSYCFAKTKWFCPQCKREIQIGFQVQGSNQNIILRMGNCMMMLSKTKYRVIAAIVVSYLLCLFVIEYKEKPRYVLEKSWKSLANNCGYEAFLQNQFKANSLYTQYPRLGQWTIEAIFLREKPAPERAISRLFVKMNPTQYRNNLTEDIVIYKTLHTHSSQQTHEQGDVLNISGQWQGREDGGHVFRFLATKIQKTGQKSALSDIKLINAAEKFIRVHQQEKKNQQNKKKDEKVVENKN